MHHTLMVRTVVRWPRQLLLFKLITFVHRVYSIETMKRFILVASWFAFGFWLSLPLAAANPKSDLVEKFYKNFQQTDATGRQGIWYMLDQEVPASQRDEFYACLLERGAQDPDDGRAVAWLLMDVEARARHGMAGSPRLERAVLAQAKHKDPGGGY